jgi:MscS family membrane protein
MQKEDILISLSKTDLPIWANGLIYVVFSLVLGFVISRIIQKTFYFSIKKTRFNLTHNVLKTSKYTIDYLSILVVFSIGLNVVDIGKNLHDKLLSSQTVLFSLGIYWFFAKLVNAMSKISTEKLKRNKKDGLVSVIPLLRRAIKTSVLLLILLFVMQNYGIDVGALLAGLGIGGLAVALAGKKTLENLFGGVTMFIDQPVRVGDFCKCGDVLGTIEDIGMRSTKIRTLDRTVITIPNATASELQIENYAKRDNVKLYTIIGLIYQTSTDELKNLVEEFTKILQEDERVVEETPRVRFVGFGAYSLDVEILAYVSCKDWAEFLQIRQEIYYKIKDCVAQSASDFAFPSQTLFMEK